MKKYQVYLDCSTHFFEINARNEQEAERKFIDFDKKSILRQLEAGNDIVVIEVIQ